MNRHSLVSGRTALLIVCIGCGLFSTCHADVIFLTSGKPIYGRVISQTEERVEFDQRIPASTRYRRRSLSGEEIVAIVITVRTSRLEKLHPDRPGLYREQAEELSPQRQDPEARELAIRLFLLGAKYGDRTLKRSCLIGLIPLARNTREEKRFRALARVTLGDSRQWLEPVPMANREISDETRKHRRDLQIALQALRQGNRQQGAATINQPWARETMKPFGSICTWFELKSWAAEPELKTEWLARVLELEIRLGRSEDVPHDPSGAPASVEADWATLSAIPVGNIRPVNLDNASEFKLAESVFRDGYWVSPETN